MKFIDKDKVVAEIKKLQDNCLFDICAYNMCGDLISFLDTLEVKEVDEEYNGKAMLHVLEKGVEQGRRELIDKACEWLKKWDAYRVCLEGHKDWFIEQFRKAMKE